MKWGRAKKKGPRGPAKRTAERRGIVAASRGLDARVNRFLVAAWPRLAAVGRRARALALAALRRLGRLLRPLAVLVLRALGLLERALLRLAGLARRAARRVWAAVTLHRVACAAILAAAGCLLAAQFLDYRAVEVGGPAYAGLPGASAPTVAARTAGQAHAWLLVPLALLAGGLALAALRDERRRRLGRLVFALGAIALAVVLLVDLPAGRDLGPYASRFSGARAVLYSPFYMELAAAVGLMLGGLLLYYARPCQTRISSFGRAASALRRRRRRRGSSRARGARSASPRRSGEASAPASPR